MLPSVISRAPENWCLTSFHLHQSTLVMKQYQKPRNTTHWAFVAVYCQIATQSTVSLKQT
jgi:hypothetical protein